MAFIEAASPHTMNTYGRLPIALSHGQGVRVWDVNGKPKGLTRAAYEALELESDDWFIDAEILLSARRRGLAVAELPVVFHRNEERESFVRPTAILEFLRNMARHRFRRR